MLRLSVALFLAPLFSIFLYFLVYAVISSRSNVPPTDLMAFIAGLLPFTYLGALVVWLPYVSFCEIRGLRRLRDYAGAGAVLGLVLGIVALVFPGENSINFETVLLALGSTFFGCVFGAIFWAVAFLKIGQKEVPGSK